LNGQRLPATDPGHAKIGNSLKGRITIASATLSRTHAVEAVTRSEAARIEWWNPAKTGLIPYGNPAPPGRQTHSANEQDTGVSSSIVSCTPCEYFHHPFPYAASPPEWILPVIAAVASREFARRIILARWLQPAGGRTASVKTASAQTGRSNRAVSCPACGRPGGRTSLDRPRQSR